MIHSQTHVESDLLQKLTTWQVLEQEVQVILVLKRLNKVHEEASLSSLTIDPLGQVFQDLLFILDVLDVFVTLNLIFRNLFHGKHFSSEAVLN